METKNADVAVQSNSEVRLLPRVDYLPDEKNYRLWKIHGTYKDQFFLIAGLTMEGDVLHNKIVPHIFGLFVMFLVLALSTMVWQINRGERCG